MLIPFGVFSAAGAGGGAAAGAYELISSTILSSNTTSIVFDTSALSAYKHLQLRATTRESSNTIGANFNIRFNGATTGYSYHNLSGNGTSVSSYAGANSANIILHELPYSGSTSGIFSASVVDILDFNSTSKNKTLRALTGATPANTGINLVSGVLLSTSAITSITAYTSATSFLAGSRFSLYGIKA